MGPLAIFAIVAVIGVISLAALGFALVVARNASRPRPALPLNCGDCGDVCGDGDSCTGGQCGN